MIFHHLPLIILKKTEHVDHHSPIKFYNHTKNKITNLSTKMSPCAEISGFDKIKQKVPLRFLFW